jgi:hypothetical protein
LDYTQSLAAKFCFCNTSRTYSYAAFTAEAFFRGSRS